MNNSNKTKEGEKMSYNYTADKNQTETDFINVVSAATKKANQKPAPKKGAVNSLNKKRWLE